MGLILTDTYETEQGVELQDAYVSFALNTFAIQPFVESSVKKYSFRCGYELFANVVARDGGHTSLERGSVTAVAANVYAPYDQLYASLKMVFPDSVDHDD